MSFCHDVEDWIDEQVHQSVQRQQKRRGVNASKG